MSCGGSATTNRHDNERTIKNASARFDVGVLYIFKLRIRFNLHDTSGNNDQGSEDHRVKHAMQAKVHQAVHCDSRNRDESGETSSPPKTIFRVQIAASLFQHYCCKPRKKSEADNATASHKLQIIVMRLLRRHSSRCVVVGGKRRPVAA